MIAWFKKLKRILENYSQDQKYTHQRISDLEKVIKERTNISVDVGFRQANHVIVIGQYKNTDYIQSFVIQSSDLPSFINQLKSMEKFGQVKRVDALPQFKAVLKNFNF